MVAFNYSRLLPVAYWKLVTAFELISDVGVDGLFVAFSKFDHKKERIPYFREFGLEDKAPGKNLGDKIFIVVCIDFSFKCSCCVLPVLDDFFSLFLFMRREKYVDHQRAKSHTKPDREVLQPLKIGQEGITNFS